MNDAPPPGLPCSGGDEESADSDGVGALRPRKVFSFEAEIGPCQCEIYQQAGGLNGDVANLMEHAKGGGALLVCDDERKKSKSIV